jgi:hypothetical protein
MPPIPGPRQRRLGPTYEGVDAMGRGRAKAKQTKVARELKYYSPDTDLTALQRELHSGSPFDAIRPRATEPADADEDDEYQQWASGER